MRHFWSFSNSVMTSIVLCFKNDIFSNFASFHCSKKCKITFQSDFHCFDPRKPSGLKTCSEGSEFIVLALQRFMRHDSVALQNPQSKNKCRTIGSLHRTNNAVIIINSKKLVWRKQRCFFTFCRLHPISGQGKHKK